VQRENFQADRNLMGWLAARAEHIANLVLLFFWKGRSSCCGPEFVMSVQAHHGSGSLQETYIYSSKILSDLD